MRLDTHGGRYVEGLDLASSYDLLERHSPKAIRGYRTEAELRYLVGTGVSAASIWRVRQALDAAGFPRVKIVASSGFVPASWPSTWTTPGSTITTSTPRVNPSSGSPRSGG